MLGETVLAAAPGRAILKALALGTGEPVDRNFVWNALAVIGRIVSCMPIVSCISTCSYWQGLACPSCLACSSCLACPLCLARPSCLA